MHLHALQQIVRRMGGTVEDHSSGPWNVYQLEAPDGQKWACSSVHALRVEWRDGESMSDALEDAAERVGCGLEMCDDPECDYCCPEEGQ